MRTQKQNIVFAVFATVVATASLIRLNMRLRKEAETEARQAATSREEVAVQQRKSDVINRLGKAAAIGDVATWESLMDQVKPSDLMSAMYLAAQKGQVSIFKVWYKKKWPVTSPEGYSYATKWLSSAASSQNPEAVQFLLSKGADVHSGEKEGWTALVFASQHENAEVVKLLLDAGAKVNVTIAEHTIPDHSGRNNYVMDYYGWTPLMVAAHNGNVEVVKTLLTHYADIARKSSAGDTALTLAQQKHHEDVVRVLEQADANRLTKNGIFLPE